MPVHVDGKQRVISIHALRGEGDVLDVLTKNNFWQFLSTPSVGRATHKHWRRSVSGDISIHALRGEGDCACPGVCSPAARISIHALRGEGDRDQIDGTFKRN